MFSYFLQKKEVLVITEKSPFNMCIRCDNIISNPLCAVCLGKRMSLSVSEEDPQLAELIQGFRIEGQTRCLICGESMGLCANCFSKDVYEFLADKNQQAAKSFLKHFDYDLRKDERRLF